MIWYDLFICLCFETRRSYVAQVDLSDSSSAGFTGLCCHAWLYEKEKKDPGKQGVLVHLWGQGLLKDAQVLILESGMTPRGVITWTVPSWADNQPLRPAQSIHWVFESGGGRREGWSQRRLAMMEARPGRCFPSAFEDAGGDQALAQVTVGAEKGKAVQLCPDWWLCDPGTLDC